MKSYTLSELARRISAVRHDAARAPVIITERNKPRFVLMAMEDYQALAQRTEDPRRTYLLEDIPPEEAELFDQALDRIIAGAQRVPDPRRAFLLEDITAEDAALLKRGLENASIEDAADD